MSRLMSRLLVARAGDSIGDYLTMYLVNNEPPNRVLRPSGRFEVSGVSPTQREIIF